jgi:hypothetical protein
MQIIYLRTSLQYEIFAYFATLANLFKPVF